MSQESIILSVPPEFSDMRADRFLSVKFPELSRSRIQQLISDGCITVNGNAIKSSRKLSAGESVEVRIPETAGTEILPENIPLDILYEDDDILVVNKPKGMTVHPAPGHSGGTLVNAVMYHCGDSLSGINGEVRPGIVHRIDKNTTGSLVICKNDSAHRDIAAQLEAHSITRRYRGIVHGNIREDEGTITGNIGRDPRDRKRMAIVQRGGKPAVTHYRVLERFGSYTYCEFVLETGRTHQIRVHMASKGHPLLGDDVYGPKKSAFALEGQTLHAMVLGFRHPGTGQYVEFTAPLPDYFENLLVKLRRR